MLGYLLFITYAWFSIGICSLALYVAVSRIEVENDSCLWLVIQAYITYHQWNESWNVCSKCMTLYEHTYVRMYVCMYVCMYVSTYVRTCTCYFLCTVHLVSVKLSAGVLCNWVHEINVILFCSQMHARMLVHLIYQAIKCVHSVRLVKNGLHQSQISRSWIFVKFIGLQV